MNWRGVAYRAERILGALPLDRDATLRELPTKPRCDMRPGEIFWAHATDRALVVVDELAEIDFWTGERYLYGASMPIVQFVMLS